MLRIERSVDAGLAKLDQRLKSVTCLDSKTLPNEDIDSLSSVKYRGHLPGLGQEAELLKVENCSLRNENKNLRQQVERLQQSMGISHVAAVGSATTSIEGRLISISTVNEVVN
jgi:cobalamin biosynthesis protein CbiG